MKRLFTFAVIFTLVGGIAFGLEDFEHDSETGAYTAGESIAVEPGWEILAGEATIAGSDARSGLQSLRVEGGWPPAAAVRRVPSSLLDADLIWLDLQVLPVSDDGDTVLSVIDALGAQIAFVRESETQGRLWIYDSAAGEGLPTAATFEVLSDGESLRWLRLTIRIAPPSPDSIGSWSLWVDESAIDEEWGLVEAGPEIVFHGHSSMGWHLDDLQWRASLENPFFNTGEADETADDGDKSTDSDTTESQSSDDEESSLLLSDDTTLSEDDGGFSSMSSGDSPIYVNNVTGNDSNSGLLETDAKETISGGIAAVSHEGTVIIKGTGTDYEEATISPGGKTVRLRPDGTIRLR